MMKDAGAQVLSAFRSNRNSVIELVDFDRNLVELFLTGLRELAVEVREKHNLHTASRRIENRVMALENVRRNDSLRRYYHTMFNQCVVLLVSYFGSAVHDLFREALAYAFAANVEVDATNEEVKTTWKDFASTGTVPSEVFADLLVVQKDISFQDMQSIGRAFKNHFGVVMGRTPEVNDLVVAQAARHAIVHSGAIVHPKMIRQISSANPRSLKPDIAIGTSILFAPEEIVLVGERMDWYLETLIERVIGRLALPEPVV